MNLPKLVTPVYKTKLISSNKEISYRPFLVKEEKILLTAIQSEDTTTIIDNLLQVISNCILTEENINELPYFDVLYLFIQIRSKSLGEEIDIKVKDIEQGKSFIEKMNLEEVKVIKEKQNTNIKLDKKIGLILKYPSAYDHMHFYFNQKNKSKINMDNVMDVVVNCIDKIYDEENSYASNDYSKEELKDFIENINPKQLEIISEFFNKMPKIIFEKEYTSPFTGKSIHVEIDNLLDFLI